MDKIILSFVIVWVIFVPFAWIAMRRFKPHWIGLGSDFNDQRIDNVKYHKCPKCEAGRMEPRYEQAFFMPMIGIPPGIIYRLGTPKEYVCLNCGKVLNGNFFGERYTRISLASRITRKEAVRSIITFTLLLLLTFLFVVYAF